MYFYGVLLQAISKIQDHRSVSAVYNLLRGNRSIQTVHDADMFNVKPFFGIYKSLTKTTYLTELNELKSKGLLEAGTNPESHVVVSVAGEQWLSRQQSKIPFHYYNGWKYNLIGSAFYERLHLVIQTYTNKKMNHLTFIPVVDNKSVTMWMKRFYKQMHPHEHNLLTWLYQELSTVLTSFTNEEAELFIDTFSSYKNYGLSIYQLAEKYQLTVNDVHVLLSGVIHQLLDYILKEPSKFRVLPMLIDHVLERRLITTSAQKTYHLLNQGYTLEQIASIRSLKINTIYDHIIEIALCEQDFPIEKYVDENTQQEILYAINETTTNKLSDIKKKLSNEINYFQIRLMLTKYAFGKGGAYHRI